jgi:AraC-like DNA-binding protein
MRCADSWRAARRRALLHQVQRHVAQRAAEPDLTPATVAAAFGVSVRSLHALFATTDCSFQQFLTRIRLEHAHDLLRDPQAHHLDTASIGFTAGFGEVSTFYRRFKQRYGVTPGACRLA